MLLPLSKGPHFKQNFISAELSFLLSNDEDDCDGNKDKDHWWWQYPPQNS